MSNSTSSQTLETITIANNVSTQTENEIDNKIHLNNHSPSLPLVKATITNHNITLLADSGSSISLLSEKMFNELTPILKFKRLSTGIRIKTVNSDVSFLRVLGRQLN